MQTVTIKKQIDLENVLGKQLANTVKSWRGQLMKKLPSSVYFTETKPAFYLDDGSTLKCYAIDLANSKVIGERYCGSADTSIMHKEQFNETAKAPENFALFFVETYWNGRNMSWSLTVVSPNFIKQLN